MRNNGLYLAGLIGIAVSGYFLGSLILSEPLSSEDGQSIKDPAKLIEERPVPAAVNSQNVVEKGEHQLSPVTRASSPVLRDIALLIHKHHYLAPDRKDIEQTPSALEDVNDYLSKLDPYSELIPESRRTFIESRAQKERTGPGLDYLIDEDGMLAVPVFKAPFFRSGETSAVLLDSVNSQVLQWGDFESYRFLGSFERQDTIELEFRRSGNGVSETATVHSDTYLNLPLRYYQIDDSLIIEIRRFKSGYADVFKEALQKANDVEMLVLDLRFSPGGDIYAMTDWLSMMLPADLPVAKLLKRSKDVGVELKTLSGRVLEEKAILILSSRYTASSAEIFAHVLAHYLERVVVTGEAGKGKCLAQNEFGLSDGQTLVLSTYEVILPNGKSCENNALRPTNLLEGIEFMDMPEILSGR